MVEMNNKITETEIKLAWSDWEEDQKTNPSAVNPNAFVYGWQFGWVRKNNELQDLQSEYDQMKESYEVSLETVTSAYYKKQNEIDKLKEAYEEYVALLSEDLDSAVQSAAIHGWSSNNFEKGKELRERISLIKAGLI